MISTNRTTHDQVSAGMREVTESAKADARAVDGMFEGAFFHQGIARDAMRATQDLSPANRDRAMKAPNATEFWNVVREDRERREQRSRSESGAAQLVSSGRSLRDVAAEVAHESGLPSPASLPSQPGGQLPEGSWRNLG